MDTENDANREGRPKNRLKLAYHMMSIVGVVWIDLIDRVMVVKVWMHVYGMRLAGDHFALVVFVAVCLILAISVFST